MVSPDVAQGAIPGEDRCDRKPMIAYATRPFCWQQMLINIHFRAACSVPEDSRIAAVGPQGRAVTNREEVAN
jgi:hypothetical protein